MTVVPAGRCADVHVICDSCGSVAVADGHAVSDGVVVHVAIDGWSGPTFARGPHRCPTCTRSSQSSVPHRHRSGTRTKTSRVTVGSAGSAAVVSVVGDLEFDDLDLIRDALESAVVRRRTVIVDLAGAGTTDPACVGLLIRARNAAFRRGGELVLAAPSPLLAATLRASGVTDARVFRNRAHAVAATAGAPRRTYVAGGLRRGSARP